MKALLTKMSSDNSTAFLHESNDTAAKIYTMVQGMIKKF